MADKPSLPLRIGYALEGALLWMLWTIVAALPLTWASAAVGGIARVVGPLLGPSRIARRNLARAFPEKSPAEIEAIVREVWDNFGRVAGELPHLHKINVLEDPRITIEGLEYLDRLRDDGKPGLFFTAHLGNWELSAMAGAQRGMPLAVVYRAANNPIADALIRRGRGELMGKLLPKGREGAKGAIAMLSRGGHVGVLPDQKMNDGIAVPFFGRPAMTPPALAQLALRYDCPIVPAHVIREGGFRFRIVIEPPLEVPLSGDHHADVLAITTEVSRVMEGWVRERPGQWLWLHRRWRD